MDELLENLKVFSVHALNSPNQYYPLICGISKLTVLKIFFVEIFPTSKQPRYSEEDSPKEFGQKRR